jgi:hypothetical protein
VTDALWDEPPENAREFFGALWRAGREAATKQKRVVESVRANSKGMSRDERWILFERELDRHEAPQDPVWVERELDELEFSAAERARQGAREALLAATALRHAAGGFPDPPGWMALPDDVGRPVWAPRREKTAIDIRPEATIWLERALAEAPRRIGNEIALFDVWFDWKPDMDAQEPIVVYLGGHNVGVLNTKTTRWLASSMQATAFAQAKPSASAHLARAKRLQPPYLLVVEIPVPDSDAND